MDDLNNLPRLQPYTKKELAAIYGMSYRAFETWIDSYRNELGEKIGKYYDVHQVGKIFKRFGIPRTAIVQDFDCV